MSDLSFVAGEFPRLASSAREAAEAVRSARPEGGASAFASAMPGTSLSSQMQGVEDKFADQATKIGTSLDEHADSLEAAERDFIAAEEENGQLIGSIIEGHSYGAGLSGHSVGGQGDIDTFGRTGITGHSKGAGLSGHSIGGKGDTGAFDDPDYVVSPRIGSQPGDWRIPDPIAGGPTLPPDISAPIRGVINDAVEGVKETINDIVEGAGDFDPTRIAGPIMADPDWLDGVKRR